MERQKHQAEYLRAMGVDIYVQRSASDLGADAAELESFVEEEERVVDPTPVDSDEKPKTSPLKSEDILAAEVEETGEKPKQEVELKLSNGEASIAEEAIEPLHFLWQQTDASLMLSVQIDPPTDQQARLLKAIARSLSPNKLQSGSGKWPLSDAQKTTEIETQQFLASFVQGRSEQTGTDLKLILFGEKSLNQFPILKGDHQELLGKVLPGDGKISEFRLVPSLSDMLSEPKAKSHTWQSIRDLAGS